MVDPSSDKRTSAFPSLLLLVVVGFAWIHSCTSFRNLAAPSHHHGQRTSSSSLRASLFRDEPTPVEAAEDDGTAEDDGDDEDDGTLHFLFEVNTASFDLPRISVVEEVFRSNLVRNFLVSHENARTCREFREPTPPQLLEVWKSRCSTLNATATQPTSGDPVLGFTSRERRFPGVWVETSYLVGAKYIPMNSEEAARSKAGLVLPFNNSRYEFTMLGVDRSVVSGPSAAATWMANKLAKIQNIFGWPGSSDDWSFLSVTYEENEDKTIVFLSDLILSVNRKFARPKLLASKTETLFENLLGRSIYPIVYEDVSKSMHHLEYAYMTAADQVFFEQETLIHEMAEFLITSMIETCDALKTFREESAKNVHDRLLFALKPYRESADGEIHGVYDGKETKDSVIAPSSIALVLGQSSRNLSTESLAPKNYGEEETSEGKSSSQNGQ